MDWLREEARDIYLLRLIALFLILDFLWCIAIGSIIKNKLHPILPSRFLQFPMPLIILSISIDAFIEEVLFRLIPLYTAVKIFSKKSYLILGVAIISSVIFGVLHGSPWNILIQGEGGLLYSLLYLKSGGLQGNHNKAISASTFLHASFNIIAIMGIKIFS